jgi:hypothetical protein
MKRSSTLFLKIVILFIAIVVLTTMIRFPQTEGRAANLDLIRIYTDPFIIYGYIASIPFFMALFQTFKLLGLMDKNNIFSHAAVKAVRYIKYCALASIGFLIGAILYIRVMAHGDDPAGPTMLGLIAIVTSIVIAIAAGKFQKHLQNAVKIKSKNEK